MQVGSNLAPIVIAIAAIKEEVAELKKKQALLEVELRPAILDQGPLEAGDYVVKCITSAGRKSLDKAAVKDAGIDLEPFMKQGAPFTTLTIKKK